MTTRETLLWALAAVSVIWALSGCAHSLCYDAISVNPGRGYAIVQDHCAGAVFYAPLQGRPPGEPETAVPPPDTKTPL